MTCLAVSVKRGGQRMTMLTLQLELTGTDSQAYHSRDIDTAASGFLSCKTWSLLTPVVTDTFDLERYLRGTVDSGDLKEVIHAKIR